MSSAIAVDPRPFIEFTIGDQSHIRGDGRTVGLQLDGAVERDPQCLLACLTDRILRISAA